VNTSGPVLTDNDRERSATASGIPALLSALAPLQGRNVGKILDIGCGFGGITRKVGEFVDATELYGVDIDPSVIDEATQKGVKAQRVDVENERLPYPDGDFDLVFSLGMLDYLPTFDVVFEETNRVLPIGGHVLFSLPNLGSWHNRLALLLGYQPRDIEVSDRSIVGAMPYYRHDQPAGHLHTATLRAFRELLEYHGFEPVNVTGGFWMTRQAPKPAVLVDRVFARWPSLARRYFFLAAKTSSQRGSEPAGWWKGRDALHTN
jgi:SAM-dependent methyltransferase